MPNSKIPYTSLTDNINLHRLRHNQLIDSVGDVSSLTTTSKEVVGGIKELVGRVDSINNTELLSPKMTLRDSSATNVVKGSLDVHGNLNANGLMTFDSTSITGSLTVDYPVRMNRGPLEVITGGTIITGKPRFLNPAAGDSAEFSGHVAIAGGLRVVGDAKIEGNHTIGGKLVIGDADTDTVSFAADINTNLIPDVDNSFDLGDSAKEWKDLWIDGTGNIDNLVSDTATIGSAKISDLTSGRVLLAGTSGEVEDTAKLTWNTTTGLKSTEALTVEDSAYITGNLVVGGELTANNYANNEIIINSIHTGSPTIDGGLTVNRGSFDNAKLLWDETNNWWAVHNDSAATKTDTKSRIITSAQIGVKPNSGLAYDTADGKFRLDSAQLPNFFENVTLNNVNVASLSDSAIDIHSTAGDLTLRATSGTITLTSDTGNTVITAGADIQYNAGGSDHIFRRSGTSNTPSNIEIWNPATSSLATSQGEIRWKGLDDAGNTQTYARFNSYAWVNTNTAECGKLELSVVAGGSLMPRMTWDSSSITFNNTGRLMLGTSANATTLNIVNSSGTVVKKIIGTTQ